MRTHLTTTAAGLLLMSATFANAAVLCANPSGSVFVRQACKSNETTLDAAALGLGTRTIAGFVNGEGVAGGAGFTVTKVSDGIFDLRFPAAAFTNFPAIAVSAWGLPGFFPTANVFFNTFDAGTNTWLAQIRLATQDGSVMSPFGFQFVAAQIK